MKSARFISCSIDQSKDCFLRCAYRKPETIRAADYTRAIPYYRAFGHQFMVDFCGMVDLHEYKIRIGRKYLSDTF